MAPLIPLVVPRAVIRAHRNAPAGTTYPPELPGRHQAAGRRPRLPAVLSRWRSGRPLITAHPATLRWSPPDRFSARRWASFVGPLRAKLWRADDWVGPAGRARFARNPRKPGCGCAATSCVSNPKDSRTVKGRLGGGLVFRWAFTQRPLDFDGGVHGGQQDYGRGGVDDGLAEVEGSSSVIVAISRCLPHSLPSTLATVASSLA